MKEYDVGAKVRADGSGCNVSRFVEEEAL